MQPMRSATPWLAISNAERWIGPNILGKDPLRIEIGSERDAERPRQSGGEIKATVLARQGMQTSQGRRGLPV